EEIGIIKKSGAWYSYKDENGEEIKLGQGREKAREFLKQNPEIVEKIEKTIKERLLNGS
ncbi:MAG: DNA recombination/repair protein RecA, partial [Sulfurihydrogenibium sp.]